MVNASHKVHPYVKEIVIVHVGVIAVLTLLINATTTGALVKFLGLSDSTDLQKNML